MRTLIVSDIHANLTALSAVLEDAEPYDSVWCLGDVVGYGPDPNECVQRLRELQGLQCIRGNHDAAILGKIDTRSFNNEARVSLEWLDSRLELQNRHWLETLEDRLVVEDITLAHGSPRNPVWEYVMDSNTAHQNMREFETTVCLVGHTHIPCVFQMKRGGMELTRLFSMSAASSFEIGYKAIVNPGSVGQPRDHDSRASYLIYDTTSKVWTYHRVEYDIVKVQKRIRAAGLPDQHAARLESGS
jgi:diadenosine tetraphosphatase ApaH/serine/threonine PP2A family protein phosphatase